MTEVLDIAARYGQVRERMARACALHGRDLADVTLVAVSKFHAADEIRRVAALEQLDFGENYVQEATRKMSELTALNLRWHMIGHVQSKKAAQVAGKYALLHTLDSIRLANMLEKALATTNLSQEVLIEINIAEEASKSGIGAADLPALCGHVLQNCPHLKLRGLMCMPPVFDAGEAARPFFARLRELREDTEDRLAIALPELSMGMSGDFEWAIAEGATIIRVGTDIFGPRPPKKSSPSD